jgi:hypothetical protein
MESSSLEQTSAGSIQDPSNEDSMGVRCKNPIFCLSSDALSKYGTQQFAH